MIYEIKADKLTLYDKKDGPRQSQVYIAPESLSSSSGLGRLFIVIDIKSKEKKVPEMISQIINELSEYYYHSPTKNMEAALETTCQYFNENIMDITGKKNNWVDEKINILIAGIQDNNLALSSHGSTKAWLIREEKIHEVIDGKKKKNKNEKKFLSQLISGELLNEDNLILTDVAIFNYFNNEKILQTVSTLAPTQACAFFKNTLIDFKTPVNFGTIVVRFLAHKKENREQDVLAEDTENTARKTDDNQFLRTAEPGTIMKFSSNVASTVGQKVKSATQKLPKINLKNKTDKEKKSLEKNTETPEEETTKKKLINFQFREYKLIIAIVILIAIIGISLSSVGNKRETAKIIDERGILLTQAEEKLPSIEAALIYKDKDRAREIINETRDIITRIPTDKMTDEEKARLGEVNSQIEEYVYDIFNLVKLTSYSEKNISGEPLISAVNSFFLDGDLYTASDKNIIKISTDGKSEKIISLPETIKKILPFDGNMIVAWNSSNTIYFVDLYNNTSRPEKIEIPEDDKLIDIDTYAKRIYALGKNNIYKYSYDNGNFSSPSTWLANSDTNVSGNHSISIDSSVWLSANSGEITKLFKGKKEIFSLGQTYEPLDPSSTIYTHEDTSYLYIINRADNQAIIADKQGNIKLQIMSTDEPILALTDGPDDKAYVITASGVYEIAI